MRFKDFLDEAKHREDISLERAVELLKANCKDFLATADAMIYRGSRNQREEAYLVQGEAGGRTSANTTNYYTVIMDNFLPKHGYPKRGTSIICANAENRSTASGYGRLYVIAPYDGVEFGVCDGDDIWHTRIKVGIARNAKRIDYWNDQFEELGVPDYSFESMVDYIEEVLDDPEDDNFNLLSDMFSKGKVAKQLEDSYSASSMNLTLASTAEPARYARGARELWIGGKCVAIRADIWEKDIEGKL